MYSLFRISYSSVSKRFANTKTMGWRISCSDINANIREYI